MQIPSFTKTYHVSSYASINASNPALSTDGKTVIVTGGGAGGIGASIVSSFARSGAAKIVILGRTKRTLQETQSYIENAFPPTKVFCIVADTSDTESMISAASATTSIVGLWDVFVHNAGYMPDNSTVAEADTDDWWRGFEVNVKSIQLIAKHFLPTAGPGSPTLIATSTAAMHAYSSWATGMSSYSASKLAAAKVVEFIGAENPRIRVFSAHPGFQDTAMSRKSWSQRGQALDEMKCDEPELVGDFMVWLASPDAEFLRGRFVWCDWDVEELKRRAEEIKASETLLKPTVGGWPFDSK